MCERMLALCRDRTALEAPFGPFVGERRASLQRIAEKSGNPDNLIAHIIMRHNSDAQLRSALSNDENAERFLVALEASIDNARSVRDARQKPAEVRLDGLEIGVLIECAFVGAKPSQSGIDEEQIHRIKSYSQELRPLLPSESFLREKKL